MRAAFTTLENGGQLEDVQKAASHRDRGTTKLYDRRGYIPRRRSRSSRAADLSGLCCTIVGASL
jgi:hypothetical protein